MPVLASFHSGVFVGVEVVPRHRRYGTCPISVQAFTVRVPRLSRPSSAGFVFRKKPKSAESKCRVAGQIRVVKGLGRQLTILVQITFVIAANSLLKAQLNLQPS